MGEKLELEISLEIKQALINAKAMGDELRTLVVETRRVAPSTAEVKEMMSRVGVSMQNVVLTAQALGDKTGGLAERHNLLAQQIRNLINSGLTPESAEVKSLTKEYASLSTELDKSRLETDDLSGAVQKLTEGAILLGGAKLLKDFVAGAVDDFSQAEASSKRLEKAMELRGISGGAERFEAYANQILNLTGASDDLVQQLAAELAYEGKSEAQIRSIIDAAADMAAVTGTDLRTAVESLSGSLSGQARELARNIPAIKDLTEEQLKAGAAISIVSQQYAGSAEEMQNSALVAFARMTESVGNLAESIGGTLAPILVTGANLITILAQAGTAAVDVFNQLPAPVRILAGGIIALTAAAIAYTAVQKSTLVATMLENAQKIITIIRTGAHTAAQWLQYAAQMAVNAAVAVGIPTQWAAIAAATASTVAVVALATGLSRAATETGNQSAAQGNLGAAVSDATVKIKDQTVALEAMRNKVVDARGAIEDLQTRMQLGFIGASSGVDASVAEYKKMVAAVQDYIVGLQLEINKNKENARLITDRKIRMADARLELTEYMQILGNLELQQKAAKAEEERLARVKKALEDARKALNDYRDAWDASQRMSAAKAQVAMGQTDKSVTQADFAVVDLEFENKRAEAIAAGLGKIIAGVWTSEKSADQSRIEEMVADWQKARGLVQTGEEQRIAAVLAKEADARAQLTATKIDDIELERDRALANAEVLFADAADKEAILAQIKKNYENELAKTRMAELQAQWAAAEKAARDQFEYEKSLAAHNKDYGGYAAKTAEGMLGGTELGQTLGMGGTVAADPVTQLISAFGDMLGEIENLNKVFNWASTIMSGVLSMIKGPMNEALQPLVDALVQIGEIIGAVLVPIIQTVGTVISVVMSVLAPVLDIIGAILPLITTVQTLLFTINPAFLILSTVLTLVAKGFSWFYDSVIVPVGNAFINVINAVIGAVNSISWLTGVTVAKLSQLLTTADQASLDDIIAAKKDTISALMDDITEYYQDQRDALKDLTSDSIQSWQDLLKVGAISEADYASKVAALNDALASGLEAIDTAEANDALMTQLEDIQTQLGEGINVDITNISALVDALVNGTASTPTVSTATEITTTTTADTTAASSAGTAAYSAMSAEQRASFDAILEAAITAGNANQVAGMRAFRGYAVGAVSVDGDQTAQIHDEEMIVPKTFADGVRAGDIGIVGTRSTTAGTTVNHTYQITVEGSVIRERDLGSAFDSATKSGQSSGRLIASRG